MVVVLSAQQSRPFLPGAPGLPPDGLMRSAGGRRPVVRAARDTPGRTGRTGVVTVLHLWTTVALSVDGVTGQSFFHHTTGGRHLPRQCGCRGAVVMSCPQQRPQSAHRESGVSAQAVHRPVHSAIGRVP